MARSARSSGSAARDGARVARQALRARAQHVANRAREGRLPRERLVDHDAEGIEVARAGERRAHGLLGRHVPGRPRGAVVALVNVDDARRDEPEVEDDDAPVGVDEHVRGLEIPVQHARLVEREHARDQAAERRAQPLLDEGALRGDAELDRVRRAPARHARRGRVDVQVGRGIPRERRHEGLDAARPDAAAHVVVEGRAAHELHREAPGLLDGEQLEELHEVRVAQIRHGAELLLEPVERRRVDALELLERDLGVARAIEGEVDGAEAARAEAAHRREVLGEAGDQRMIRRRERRRRKLGILVAHGGEVTPRLVSRAPWAASNTRSTYPIRPLVSPRRRGPRAGAAAPCQD